MKNLILLLGIMIFSLSCSEDVNSPQDESGFIGIAQTDFQGNIISDDSEDWQPRISAPGPLPALAAEPAFPNPLSGQTTIRYSLAKPLKITVLVLAFEDTIIRRLIVEQMQQAGFYQLFWDGTDDRGNPISDGVYRVEITAVDGSNSSVTFGDIRIQR